MKFSVSYQHLIFSLIFLACIFLDSTTCRRLCYSCSTEESGLKCLDSPHNVTKATVPCKFYCTIKRIEYGYGYGVSPPSTALNRSCEEQPVYLNWALQDDYFITYYRACKGHLCNGGDGREKVRNGTEGDWMEEDMKELLLGQGSASPLPFDGSRRPKLLTFLFLSIFYHRIFI